MNANDYIQHLHLLPHPEGGWYRESYRSSENILPAALPSRFSDERAFSTAIYFLLEQGNFSAFHRIQSDEVWHFYAGDAIEVIEIHPDCSLHCTVVGAKVWEGETPQHVVPAGVWFASRVKEGGGFALVGCTVAPGFDFADFHMAEREVLLREYPEHQQTIRELTRN